MPAYGQLLIGRFLLVSLCVEILMFCCSGAGSGQKAERDSLAERYSMLQRSLAQSEEDEEKLDAAGAQLRSQVR